MKTLFIILQTVLNFIALNTIFSPLVNRISPVGAASVLFALIYWLILLLISYAIAVRFKNKGY